MKLMLFLFVIPLFSFAQPDSNEEYNSIPDTLWLPNPNYYEVNHNTKTINYKLNESKKNQNNYYFRYDGINTGAYRCDLRREIWDPGKENRIINRELEKFMFDYWNKNYKVKVNDSLYTGKIILSEIHKICSQFIGNNSNKEELVEIENIYYQGVLQSSIRAKKVLSPYFMRAEKNVGFDKHLLKFAVLVNDKSKADSLVAILDSLELRIVKMASSEISAFGKGSSNDIYIIGLADTTLDIYSLQTPEPNKIIDAYKQIIKSRAFLEKKDFLEIWDILRLENENVILSKDELFVKWKPDFDTELKNVFLERYNLTITREFMGGEFIRQKRDEAYPKNLLYHHNLGSGEPYSIINIAMLLMEKGYAIFAEPNTYSTGIED